MSFNSVYEFLNNSKKDFLNNDLYKNEDSNIKLKSIKFTDIELLKVRNFNHCQEQKYKAKILLFCDIVGRDNSIVENNNLMNSNFMGLINAFIKFIESRAGESNIAYEMEKISLLGAVAEYSAKHNFIVYEIILYIKLNQDI